MALASIGQIGGIKFIKDWLRTTLKTEVDLKAVASTTPVISTGAGAPSSTPSKEGDIYIDTTNDNAYIAVGSASSSDWSLCTNAA